MKRADVPCAVLTSSSWSTAQDDTQAAELRSPVITVAPPPPPGRTVSPVNGLFHDLSDTDGELLSRAGETGLCSSAYDLHKTGLSSTSALRRRFLRSRSHQNLLRIDVRSAHSQLDTTDHPTSSFPKLFPLPTCVRRPHDESSTDCLSSPLDLAIRSSGAIIMQMCGINISPLNAAKNCRKSRSFNT